MVNTWLTQKNNFISFIICKVPNLLISHLMVLCSIEQRVFFIGLYFHWSINTNTPNYPLYPYLIALTLNFFAYLITPNTHQTPKLLTRSNNPYYVIQYKIFVELWFESYLKNWNSFEIYLIVSWIWMGNKLRVY